MTDDSVVISKKETTTSCGSTPEFIDNSTERYIDLIHRFNKDKAFDYVIGIKDREDKIIDRGFDD